MIAGNRRITDLGMQFSIRRDNHRLKEALFSGGADLDQTNNPASGSSAPPEPGDVAIATNRGLKVSTEASRDPAASLGGAADGGVRPHDAR